ncbi:MAG: hypothetical protein RL681_312 [Candidatus Parcubacteria bacterium]|jgi:hypothetical protein
MAEGTTIPDARRLTLPPSYMPPFQVVAQVLRGIRSFKADPERSAAVLTIGLRFLEANPYGESLWCGRNETLYRTQRTVWLTAADLDIAIEALVALGVVRHRGLGEAVQYAVKLDFEEQGLSEDAVKVISALRQLRRDEFHERKRNGI